MRISYSLLIKTTTKSTGLVSDRPVDSKSIDLVLNTNRTLLLPLANVLGEKSNLKTYPHTEKVASKTNSSSKINISTYVNSNSELSNSLDISRLNHYLSQ